MSYRDGLPCLNRNHKHYAQVQGDMAIFGLPWCDFFVWTSAEENNFIIERVYFDQDFVTAMIKKVVSFYFKHIFPKVMGHT